MAHHQALTQHQAVQSSAHQDVHQNRALSKNEDHCKDPGVQIEVSVKEEQRLNDGNREKATETRLPVISMTG